jgi:hypothetical protein
LNNQQYHGPLCDIAPDEPIFMLEFELAAGEYPTDMVIPICFMNEDDINSNSVSDSTGYHVWYGDGCSDAPDSSQFGTLLLNMECGSIRVSDECDLLIGDLNMNRRPYEVGDIILLANHIMDPDAYPFTFLQNVASDVNQDGLWASIADLIFMINVINGFDPLPKPVPFDTEPVQFIVEHTISGETQLAIVSEYDVGGFVIDIPAMQRDLVLDENLGMTAMISGDDQNTRLMVYDDEGATISAGRTEILTILLPDGIELDEEAISVSDAGGGMVTAMVKEIVPLPETFGLTNCYPNPFNMTTTIEFALPERNNVKLEIYDVSGRLVKQLVSGDLEAGIHKLKWNGTASSGEDVASGIYFAILKSSRQDLDSSIKKLVLLK